MSSNELWNRDMEMEGKNKIEIVQDRFLKWVTGVGRFVPGIW